jgi:hypothetical protein
LAAAAVLLVVGRVAWSQQAEPIPARPTTPRQEDVLPAPPTPDPDADNERRCTSARRRAGNLLFRQTENGAWPLSDTRPERETGVPYGTVENVS